MNVGIKSENMKRIDSDDDFQGYPRVPRTSSLLAQQSGNT